MWHQSCTFMRFVSVDWLRSIDGRKYERVMCSTICALDRFDNNSPSVNGEGRLRFTYLFVSVRQGKDRRQQEWREDRVAAASHRLCVQCKSPLELYLRRKHFLFQTMGVDHRVDRGTCPPLLFEVRDVVFRPPTFWAIYYTMVVLAYPLNVINLLIMHSKTHLIWYV